MKTYFAVVASILMLATTAFGRGSTALPVDNGFQTPRTAHYALDDKTPMATSATASVPVDLIVDRGGGMTHRHGGLSSRPNGGHRFHSRPFGDRFSHRDFDRNRSFHHRDFNRNRFFHRDFDRHHFVPRHRFR